LGKRPDGDSRLDYWPWAQANRKANEAVFSGLYPYGYMVYPSNDHSPVQVRMREFSPMIPGDLENSSLPVAVQEFELSNPTGKDVDASVMVSMPNFIGWQMVLEKPDTKEEYVFSKTGEGQYHRLKTEGNYMGLVMGSKKSPDDRLNGQICLLTETRPG